MPRRPTIPFYDWRIALDLEHNQQVQNAPGMPAYQCYCELCLAWPDLVKNLLPLDLLDGLRRLGIAVDQPNDLYAHPKTGDEPRAARVIYHIVGKIISGPPGLIDNRETGHTEQDYQTIRARPFLGLRIVKGKDSWGLTPDFRQSGNSEVLALDLRFLA